MSESAKADSASAGTETKAGAGLEKASRAVDRLASAMTVVFFGFMTLVVILGVFFRYVLNAPLSWPEEVSRYLMIWGASVGVTIGIREEEHVGLTILLDSMKSRAARMVLHTIILLLVLTFLVIMLVYAIPMTKEGTMMQMQSFSVSMFIAYAAIPVAMVLAIVQVILVYALKLVRGDAKLRDMTVIDI